MTSHNRVLHVKSPFLAGLTSNSLMGLCSSSPLTANEKSTKTSTWTNPGPRPAKPPHKKPRPMSSEADFELLERVGRGAYGEVFKARDRRTEEIVAIKRIARSDIDRFVVEEVQNLSKCRHHQIIQFKEVRSPFQSSFFPSQPYQP